MSTQEHVITLQARTIVAALIEGVPIDALEGNVDELLVAMGESGHLNPNNAYFFEAQSASTLQVINDTEGWTLLVNVDTGEVTSPPANEIAMPGPAATQLAPVAYYRVLVDQAGCPFFRTSRLHNVGAMLQAKAILLNGANGTIGVRVLVVLTTGAGRILTEAELTELAVG